MTTLSVPTLYGIIRTYEIQSREELCAILITMSNKFFNDFPPMSLMACTLISQICLMAPSNIPPHYIKTVPIHAGLAKSRIRPVLLLRDSIPPAGPVSKFETCSYDNNHKPFNNFPLCCSLLYIFDQLMGNV